MKISYPSLIASVAFAALPALGLVQVHASPAAPAATAAAASPAVQKAGATEASPATLTDAEIKKINLDSKELTIKHGPLANLKMPGMTMAFKVKDPAMLQQVKTGDKVRVFVEKIGETFTITTLQKQP